MNTKSRVLIVLVIVAALLALGAVYALAQTGGQINACVQRDGLLRFATDPSSCKKGEQAVYWNVMGERGPAGLACWDLDRDGVADPEEDVTADGVVDVQDCKGPAGAPGAPGETGPAGAPGAPGEIGPAGPASLGALEGTVCTRDGKQGLLQVTVDPNSGQVALNCHFPAITVKGYYPLNEIHISVTGGSLLSGAALESEYNPSQWFCGPTTGDCHPVFTAGSTVSLRSSTYYYKVEVLCPDGTMMTVEPPGLYDCPPVIMDGDKTLSITEVR